MRTNRKKEIKKWKKEGREERREKQRTRRNDRTSAKRRVPYVNTRGSTLAHNVEESERMRKFIGLLNG